MMKIERILLVILCCIAFISCDGNHSSTGPDEPSSTPDYATRTATVTYVYDGDTIQVNGNEKVRYIGIDTPERGECYYWEATLRNRDLVDDRVVTLQICHDAPVDQYGRTLAHVFVGDVLVNAVLVREGFARAYRVPPCTTRADEYAEMEREARASGRGRWSACR